MVRLEFYCGEQMCLVLGQASCLHYPTDSPLSVVHLNTSDFCPPVKCLNFFQHSYTLFCYSGATCNQWNMEGPNIISSTSSTVAFSGSGSVVFGPNIERCLLILQAKSDMCIVREGILEWRKESCSYLSQQNEK